MAWPRAILRCLMRHADKASQSNHDGKACRYYLTRHAEIAEFAMPVAVQQKIAAFDVAMYELLAVQVLKGLCSL